MTIEKLREEIREQLDNDMKSLVKDYKKTALNSETFDIESMVEKYRLSDDLINKIINEELKAHGGEHALNTLSYVAYRVNTDVYRRCFDILLRGEDNNSGVYVDEYFSKSMTRDQWAFVISVRMTEEIKDYMTQIDKMGTCGFLNEDKASNLVKDLTRLYEIFNDTLKDTPNIPVNINKTREKLRYIVNEFMDDEFIKHSRIVDSFYNNYDENANPPNDIPEETRNYGIAKEEEITHRAWRQLLSDHDREVMIETFKCLKQYLTYVEESRFIVSEED